MGFFARIARLFGIIGLMSVVFIFYSIARPHFERATWVHQVMLTSAYPFQKFLTNISTVVGYVKDHYIMLVGVSEENELLRNKVSELQYKVYELTETKQELYRLNELLNMSGGAQGAIVARVIWNNPRMELKMVEIDKGSRHGIEPNQVVVGRGGLIGRVGQVAYRTSKVFLITDPNSSVDVIDQRSRARAILVGKAMETGLRPGPYFMNRMEYLRRTSDITKGDVIVTSGLDGVYPKGIPVGTIVNVEKKKYGIFQDADVVPFEDMSQLEEVMVLKK